MAAADIVMAAARHDTAVTDVDDACLFAGMHRAADENRYHRLDRDPDLLPVGDHRAAEGVVEAVAGLPAVHAFLLAPPAACRNW